MTCHTHFVKESTAHWKVIIELLAFSSVIRFGRKNLTGGCNWHWLPRKHRDLCASLVPCDPLPLPSQPPLGWKVIESSNHEKWPIISILLSINILLEVLAMLVERVLYTPWHGATNTAYLDNDCNPQIAAMYGVMRPSMKAGTYRVYLLLKKVF